MDARSCAYLLWVTIVISIGVQLYVAVRHDSSFPGRHHLPHSKLELKQCHQAANGLVLCEPWTLDSYLESLVGQSPVKLSMFEHRVLNDVWSALSRPLDLPAHWTWMWLVLVAGFLLYTLVSLECAWRVVPYVPVHQTESAVLLLCTLVCLLVTILSQWDAYMSSPAVPFSHDYVQSLPCPNDGCVVPINPVFAQTALLLYRATPIFSWLIFVPALCAMLNLALAMTMFAIGFSGLVANITIVFPSIVNAPPPSTATLAPTSEPEKNKQQ
jgi:hypothetical protein